MLPYCDCNAMIFEDTCCEHTHMASGAIVQALSDSRPPAFGGTLNNEHTYLTICGLFQCDKTNTFQPGLVVMLLKGQAADVSHPWLHSLFSTRSALQDFLDHRILVSPFTAATTILHKRAETWQRKEAPLNCDCSQISHSYWVNNFTIGCATTLLPQSIIRFTNSIPCEDCIYINEDAIIMADILQKEPISSADILNICNKHRHQHKIQVPLLIIIDCYTLRNSMKHTVVIFVSSQWLCRVLQHESHMPQPNKHFEELVLQMCQINEEASVCFSNVYFHPMYCEYTVNVHVKGKCSMD